MSASIGRRVEDQKTIVRLTSISAYVALAAFAGAIVLWLGDARIDQGTRALSDKQIKQDVRIDNLEKTNRENAIWKKRIEDKLDRILELMIKDG